MGYGSDCKAYLGQSGFGVYYVMLMGGYEGTLLVFLQVSTVPEATPLPSS